MISYCYCLVEGRDGWREEELEVSKWSYSLRKEVGEVKQEGRGEREGKKV